MSTIKVQGNGNFVFQGQSGNNVKINGENIEITPNQATPKEILIEMIDLDLQGTFSKLDSLNWGNRKGMYVDLKKEFIDRPVGFSLNSLRSRLKILISYIDCSSFTESSKITIMDNKQRIQNAISKGDIAGALEILNTFSDDAIQLMSRWNTLSREKRMGIISNSDEQMHRNRIVEAILSYAGCEAGREVVSPSQGWEPQLLQIIKDNDRKNEEAAKQATKLLDTFRSYYDLKRTRAFFDRSGNELKEIEQRFEDFKADLNRSENEGVDKFIDRVAEHISARIPEWPSIGDAYRLCLGRGFRSQFIEVNISATPNDNDAKLSAVKTIEDFLGTL